MALSLDEARAATALASLPYITHSRLRRLLAHGRPNEVVGEILRGPAGVHVESRRQLLGERPRGLEIPLGELWRRFLGEVDSSLVSGVEVHLWGDPGYPEVLLRDPAAPAVLFSRGDVTALDAPRVGIIGTRNSTAFGRATAVAFARELAEAGVAIVSGLARGIDAAAHRGALKAGRHEAGRHEAGRHESGRPIAVVASGPDVVYPRENSTLWDEVITHGVLLSESPPGTQPEAFRFPLRNRITAALCDVLLVVESRLDGGSMITVREALERGITVMAVPGSTATRSAQGTNMLIRDGAAVALESADVLAVLGLDARRRTRSFDARRVPDDSDLRLLEVMGDEPLSLDLVADRAARELGLSLGDVAVALGRLEATGWIMCTAGWFERLPAP